MGTIAARDCLRVLELTETVAAISFSRSARRPTCARERAGAAAGRCATPCADTFRCCARTAARTATSSGCSRSCATASLPSASSTACEASDRRARGRARVHRRRREPGRDRHSPTGSPWSSSCAGMAGTKGVGGGLPRAQGAGAASRRRSRAAARSTSFRPTAWRATPTSPGVTDLIIDGDRFRFRDQAGGDDVDLAQKPGGAPVRRELRRSVQRRPESAARALRGRLPAPTAIAGSCTLTPRHAPMKSLIPSFILRGAGRALREMVMVETDGDRTTTTFDRVETDHASARTRSESSSPPRPRRFPVTSLPSRLAFAVIVLAMVAFCASRLTFSTNITNFMPRGHAQDLATISSKLADSELSRTMILSIGAPPHLGRRRRRRRAGREAAPESGRRLGADGHRPGADPQTSTRSTSRAATPFSPTAPRTRDSRAAPAGGPAHARRRGEARAGAAHLDPVAS